jgi:hypothetical protein
MSNQMQNNDFLLDSINESIEAGADAITAQFALHKLNTVGSVNIQECTTVFLMAQEILTEGSDDLIPDNIEIPDELEDSEDGEDLDVSDLEGIVLPTADGGLMVVENGVLVPYSEEPADAPVASNASENGDNIQESETNIDGSGEDNTPETIQESEIDHSSHSSIVNSMIQQLNFKGGF